MDLGMSSVLIRFRMLGANGGDNSRGTRHLGVTVGTVRQSERRSIRAASKTVRLNLSSPRFSNRINITAPNERHGRRTDGRRKHGGSRQPKRSILFTSHQTEIDFRTTELIKRQEFASATERSGRDSSACPYFCKLFFNKGDLNTTTIITSFELSSHHLKLRRIYS